MIGVGYVLHWRTISHDALMHKPCDARTQNLGMHERTRSNIKKLLEELDMNPRQLALRVQRYPGLEKTSPSTITRFINGSTIDVHYALLKAIATELGTSVDGLTGDAALKKYDMQIATVVRAMEVLPDFDKEILVNTSSQLAKRYEPED